MPRGSKASYSSKQKRQAEHIEEGYERRGVGRREAARRAWATVNKETGGGKKSGSGRGKRRAMPPRARAGASAVAPPPSARPPRARARRKKRPHAQAPRLALKDGLRRRGERDNSTP